MERIAYAHNTSDSLPLATLQPVGLHSDHDALSIAELSPILIASPHPDDETLGCGGLIAHCATLACSVTVLAMTNGEASHPGDTSWREWLGETRKQEQRNALKALGLTDPDVISLELPDGVLDHLDQEHYERLHDLILGVIHARGIRTLLVPAVDDCHADHRVTARLLAKVALSQPVGYFLSYQIWPPEVRPVGVAANEREYAHDISDLVDLKRAAVFLHRSQLSTIDLAHTEGFRMPEALLEAKLNHTESFSLVLDIAKWSK